MLQMGGFVSKKAFDSSKDMLETQDLDASGSDVLLTPKPNPMIRVRVDLDCLIKTAMDLLSIVFQPQ